MKPFAVLISLCLLATSACAEEPAPAAAPAGEATPGGPVIATPGGESGEPKKVQPLKPRPDSAISIVMQLPVVRKWGDWMQSKNDGSSITVWGEALKRVGDYDCWGVAVGEESKDGVRVWRRFCVQKTGLEIWVESVPTHDGDDITYTPYDNWQLKCDPTPSSAGTC